MGTGFKAFIKFVTVFPLFFCFGSLVLGPGAGGILAPSPGMEPAAPALRGEVLTTGPPGKTSCRVWLVAPGLDGVALALAMLLLF